MAPSVQDELFKLAKVVHPLVLRLSRGRIGSRVGGMPVVILSTTGRTSGRLRPTPLTVIEHQGHTYVVASKGGDAHHPSWYLNLVAHAEVSVERDGRTLPMVARVLSPPERAELWPVVTATYRGYAGYQERTDREIPVVELHPAPR